MSSGGCNGQVGAEGSERRQKVHPHGDIEWQNVRCAVTHCVRFGDPEQNLQQAKHRLSACQQHNRAKEKHEQSVVFLPDAVVQPNAVMIEDFDAEVAPPAVLCLFLDMYLANVAEASLDDVLVPRRIEGHWFYS